VAAPTSNFMRLAGVFLLCALQAIIGTAIVETPFFAIFRPNTVVGVVLKEYVLSVAIAFAIGYLVYHHWRLVQSKWLWLAGLCWLILGALRSLVQPSVMEGRLDALYRDMSGFGCVPSTGCASFFGYMVPSLRAICYSVGALCCSRVVRVPGEQSKSDESMGDLRSEEPRTAPLTDG